MRSTYTGASVRIAIYVSSARTGFTTTSPFPLQTTCAVASIAIATVAAIAAAVAIHGFLASSHLH